ncbi:hypothetical protein J2S13_001946 [Oikeobacillus pervagus]|uniref:Plasmid pRiA4b Orf3-like domain-containing protein n=1 Tax=Oikeobacillus pervagus TaxID=1325931 RepID=A0AAJ1SZ70_9BACI|nr:plasmid pRiA4b ORF-3 family protein [Oikeobacillus pervagus]MDQ0215528.1 hypothetical protein [Oikeobacillus pervagus]
MVQIKNSFIYQFKISLRHIEPMIWRIFQVSNQISFKTLHEVIQTVMGWDDAHLYEFKYGPIVIGVPLDDFVGTEVHKDASKMKISSLSLKLGDVLQYQYDFGDHWQHLLELEGIFPRNPQSVLPICLGGERACPPEDIGGVPGYQYLLHLLQPSSASDQYTELISSIGEMYDPEFFHLDQVNWNLKKLK